MAMNTESSMPTIIDLYASEKNLTRDDMVSMIVNHLAPKGRDGNPLATKADVIMFLQIARRFDLDVFSGEIYLIPSQRGIKTYVSIDGYTKIATRHPDYDGVDFDFEWEGGKPLCCTCTIHRKNHSHPTRVTEYLQECARDTVPWRTSPARMLRHKAYIQAVRVAFGISAAMSEEDDAPAAPVVTLEPTKPTKPVESVIPRRPPPAPAPRPDPTRPPQLDVLEQKPVTIEAKAEPAKEEPFDLERYVDSISAGLKAAKSRQDIDMLWENMDVDGVMERVEDEEATSLVRQMRAKAEKRIAPSRP